MAYTYVKEKTSIVAYNEGTNHKFAGRYDIPSGKFYGVNNKEVSTLPLAFQRKALDSQSSNSVLAYNMLYVCNSAAVRSRPQRLEEFLSLNIPIYGRESFGVLMGDDREYPLTKKFLQQYFEYCKQERYPSVTINHQQYYYYKHQTVKEMLSRQRINEILAHYSPNIRHYIAYEINYDFHDYSHTAENLILLAKCLERLRDEGVWNDESTSYQTPNIHINIATLITQWIAQSNYLNLPLEVPRNFVSTVIKLGAEVSLKRSIERDKIIAEVNGNPKLLYENDTFFVHPLLSAAEMINEGNAQHNCVGRLYINHVADKDCAIVSIRKKSEPDQSYITCEIYPNGCIGQRYLQYNRAIPEDTPESSFIAEYEKHLRKVLA